MLVFNIIHEIAPTYVAAAQKLGVPRLTVQRWIKPSVGVRSTAHARLILDELAKEPPVTGEDWQQVWAAPGPAKRGGADGLT